MATKAELVSRTLWILRARSNGQTANADDTVDVDAVIDDKLDDLALRKVIYIGDSDDLPRGSMDWLTRLMVLVVNAAYGKEPPDYPARILHAESMIRAQQAQDEFGVQQAEYF